MRENELLVTIATFETVWEAAIARGVLEAAGIRALVPEETLLRSTRNTILPTGSLQVLQSDKDRALVELRRSQIRLVQPNERE